MELVYSNKIPTASDYNDLTNNVDWGKRDEKIVEIALEQSLYCVCVYDNSKLIGFARIIGDGAIFLYIQDVMVNKEYQNMNIGKEIMNQLLEKIEDYKKINPNARVYLGASKGKEGFYRKFGFKERKECGLGEGMILV